MIGGSRSECCYCKRVKRSAVEEGQATEELGPRSQSWGRAPLRITSCVASAVRVCDKEMAGDKATATSKPVSGW